MARGFGARLTYSTLSVLRCGDVESDLWREASRLIRPVDSSPTCPPPPVVRRRWLRQLSSCGFGSRHSCCLPPGKRRMWIRDQPKPHSGKACAGIVGFLTDATTPPSPRTGLGVDIALQCASMRLVSSQTIYPSVRNGELEVLPRINPTSPSYPAISG